MDLKQTCVASVVVVVNAVVVEGIGKEPSCCFVVVVVVTWFGRVDIDGVVEPIMPFVH